MTTETTHTCSYSCERPGCIRAQRDELVARLTAAQQPAAPSGEAGAFDANFLRHIASVCRAAYDLCQPKPQRTPEDPREYHGELCLSELANIADEIERRLAAPSGKAGDGCHCATCTCNPNMTPAVRFDLSPAQTEGAIREHLIRLGWTPPDEVEALRAERDALARENEAMKRCAIKYLGWLGVTHMPLDEALRGDMSDPTMCGDAAIAAANGGGNG